ncbi:MAG: LLM class F420-dependent oxidoreductase [bacterium]|nr:LLM class F420-dependent oxidoreductase [bacterium]
MKIGVSFANAGPFAFPEALVHLAQTAERAGVESLWSVEHVVIPVGYQSAYPYDRSGKMPAPENVPIPDPLLPMAYVAAVTKTIRVGTGILILPQRHPLYVAKEAATLDVLSKGRAFLGIGIGWLEEEFDALGIPFGERAARTAETVRAMRSLWKPEPEPFEGKFFRWGRLESNPKPVQDPFPIHVGGHTDLAAKRAARFGDGFFPGVADVESLRRLLGVMRAECERIGRDPASIEVTGAGWRLQPDDVRRMADAGVHRLVVPPPAFDPEGIERGFAKLHEKLIAKR